MVPSNDTEAAHTVHQLPQHLSFKNVNRRKQVKLNVHTLPNPNAPSVHQAYTFVSHSQGFQARGSHVISSQTEPQIETEVDTTIDEDYNQHFDNDRDIYDVCDTEHVEACGDKTKRKRTAGVGLVL